MIDDTASQTPSRTPTHQYENNNKHQQQSLILLGEVGYMDHTMPFDLLKTKLKKCIPMFSTDKTNEIVGNTYLLT